MSKSQEKHLTRDDIQHLSEDQRMMKLEMYTGSKKQKPREEWLYDFSDGSIKKNIITIPECVERCFLEPLSNASDNVHRSRRFGTYPGKVYIYVSRTRIIIENSGTPIPVQYKEEDEMYVPELIFGVPGSSSHYNEEVRHEAGVNGLGVKLTNVFSKYFKVEILDPINKKSYVQEWEGIGLEGRKEPTITPHKSRDSLVRVTFDLDYGHFEYSSDESPDDIFPLFARHAADISFTTKVPVTFEYESTKGDPKAIEFEVGHPRNYAYLYFGESVKNSIIHYEWPEGTRVIKQEDGRQVSRNGKVIPLVEMCVIDTPDNSENISFVNSMMTRDGGIHVETALKSVSDHIVKFVNSKDDDGLTITLKHIRPNISIVLATMVKNPGFRGQTKNKLTDPNPFIPRIRVSEKEVKPVMEWDMIQHLLAILEAKKRALLSKSDGKKRRNISTRTGRDANDAGTRKSELCTLGIIEGLSASAYLNKLTDNMENGRDRWGVFPIRGKFLNVLNAKVEKISKNKEIFELKKMLGLAERTDYNKPENRKSLRYGRVVIMADADDDGKHIVALLLLYFHKFYPSLLQCGFVFNYLTPIIRVTKGKRKHKFYTMSEFEKWKGRTKGFGGWKITYFKGLGRATDSQIKEDYEDQRIVHCVYDDYAPQTINLAFSRENRDERKAWLAHFRDVLDVEVVDSQPISEYINTELVKFGHLGLRRAIPSAMDGFKDCQRKAIWGAFKIWSDGHYGVLKPGNTKYRELKVARFAAKTAEITMYHHGEVSLGNAIIAMAQDFPGSNNLAYFTQDGQFGTRETGGKDAADPRYVETRPEHLLAYLIRAEDLEILELKEDEGEVIEPKFFVPILPLALINGANGIAVGYSTHIPGHNPLIVSGWYKAKIRGKTLPDVMPWFRGFSGTVEVIDRRRKKRVKPKKSILDMFPKPDASLSPTDEDNQIPEPEDKNTLEEPPLNEEKGDDDVHNDPFEPEYWKDFKEYVREYREEKGRPLYSLITKGEFHIKPNGKIVVTELPIGRWTHSYMKWMEYLRDEKKLLKNVRDISTSESPCFEITGFKPIPSHKSLSLIKQYGMSNMYLLDENYQPVRFDTVSEYLEYFYEKRLDYYALRKEHQVRCWNAALENIHQKMNFIQAVVDKTLVIENRQKADIFKDMDEMGFPHKLLSETSMSKLTEDEISNLRNRIVELENDIETLESTEPKEIWFKELCEFERAYRKRYKVSAKGDKIRVKGNKK